MIYPRFNRKRYLEYALENISGNQNDAKGMEIAWIGFGVYLVYLGIFLCMENGFSLLRVNCPGVPSVFSSAQRLTCGPVRVGSA